MITYKILMCDDNIQYIKRLRTEISTVNMHNKYYQIDMTVGSTPTECIKLIRNNVYDIIILDICIKSTSVKSQTVSEKIRSELGHEFYGQELYKEITALDITSKIFVLSNLPVLESRNIFNDANVEYFNKTMSTPKQIAQYMKNYFSTGKERIYNNAFVVYGHDESMRNSVDNYIKELGINSIDLFQDSSGGLQSVFDALCESIDTAECAIVLLSPDDIILDKEKLEMFYRARQNVIFEMGLFAGHLGKNKVIVLYHKHSKFEFPSDINGIFYIEYDCFGKWKERLKCNLQKIGFSV